MDPRETLKIGTAMAYEQLFVAGRALTPEELTLDGDPLEWRVRILTGLIPDMSGWMRHRKRVYMSPHLDEQEKIQVRVVGCNIVREDVRWGYFYPKAGWGLDGRPCLVLDYDVPCNSFLTNHIKDRVRATSDPRLLIGKLYVGDSFGGYFTMERDA